MIANARDYNDSSRRLRQLERVLLIVELVAPLHCGARLSELVADVNDILGAEYSERTIRRDLHALEQMGFVEPVQTQERYRPAMASPRWRWADRSIRSAICRHAAERQAESRENSASACRGSGINIDPGGELSS